MFDPTTSQMHSGGYKRMDIFTVYICKCIDWRIRYLISNWSIMCQMSVYMIEMKENCDKTPSDNAN